MGVSKHSVRVLVSNQALSGDC